MSQPPDYIQQPLGRDQRVRRPPGRFCAWHNAVRQHQLRGQYLDDLCKQTGELPLWPAVVHVPEGFTQPGQTAETVFYRQSQTGLRVGLDSREIDKEIAVQGRNCQDCASAEGRTTVWSGKISVLLVWPQAGFRPS